MKHNFFFAKENLFLKKELTNELLKKFDQMYQKNTELKKNTNILELRKKDIMKIPLLFSLSNKIKKKFELITGHSDLSFNKLWLVSTPSNDKNKAILPYIPHIDKHRCLKAMVYLHDVKLEHGPIHIGRAKNTIYIEQKRKELPRDYAVKGLNIIDDKDLASNLNPITGEAGDVIFFDTNTPHLAGTVKNGYCRKVLRFDFEGPFFNPKLSILDRLINKLKPPTHT